MLFRMLDSVFSNRSWYRRWRGGLWINVTPRPYPYISLWIRDSGPSSCEHVNLVEFNGQDITAQYREEIEST